MKIRYGYVCKECGRHNLRLVSAGRFKWYAECSECHYSTGTAWTRNGAIKKWNAVMAQKEFTEEAGEHLIKMYSPVAWADCINEVMKEVEICK